ncbi:MAG: nickel-dependent lactate racemase [Bacillota bacterium]
MSRTYQLDWGKEKLAVSFPEDCQVREIEIREMEPIKDLEAAVMAALEGPIGEPPLREIIKPGEKVVIVMSDITRLSYRTDAYLHLVLEVLNQAGIPDADIKIVMATGTHRAQTPAEHRLLVGDRVYGRVEIIDHDCLAEDQVSLGRTTRGTEVVVNRHVAEADRVIITGGITFHRLAGYGGGRKSLAPGVCSYATIQQNHGLALIDIDASGVNPAVDTGILAGNPVAEDMMEIAQIIGCDFLINGVMDGHGQFISIVAGDLEEAFAAGCRVVDQAYGIPVQGQTDLVVAGCGGYPKDIQLYQSVKGLFNAMYAVRPGGVIILVSECSDGIGSPEFSQWFKYSDIEIMRTALGKAFTIPGFIALCTAGIIQRSKAILVSTLPPEQVRQCMFEPAATLEEAMAMAKDWLGKYQSVTVMPHAMLTFPMLKGEAGVLERVAICDKPFFRSVF